MGEMYCHTRVQGLASTPEREFGDRIERETGKREGSRSKGRRGRNQDFATPYRTAIYRMDQRPQPVGFAEGSQNGRWNSHLFTFLVDGVVLPAIGFGGSEIRALSLGRDYTDVVILRGLHG